MSLQNAVCHYKILKAEGVTGPLLQYTHAQLASIERQSPGVGPPGTAAVGLDVDVLSEPAARALANAVSRCDETWATALIGLEAVSVVQYQFLSARTALKAVGQFRVKGAPPELAQPRLMLFRRAWETPAAGIALLEIAQPTRDWKQRAPYGLKQRSQRTARHFVELTFIITNGAAAIAETVAAPTLLVELTSSGMMEGGLYADDWKHTKY